MAEPSTNLPHPVSGAHTGLWVIEMKQRPEVGVDPRIKEWWDHVLAGETDEPHPIYGDQLHVRLRGGRLELSGRLERRSDVEQLTAQARHRVGRGVDEVDASHLGVVEKKERSGVADQTLVASYADRTTAELAARLIDEHARLRPRRETIIDRATVSRLASLLPPELAGDARKRIERGESLLILRVDETRAYTVRSLMEQDTRSLWTIAVPPARVRRG